MEEAKSVVMDDATYERLANWQRAELEFKAKLYDADEHIDRLRADIARVEKVKVEMKSKLARVREKSRVETERALAELGFAGKTVGITAESPHIVSEAPRVE